MTILKRGYKRLIVFEILTIIMAVLNSIVFKFSSNFYIIVFITIILFIFKYFFGFEKDAHRYIKDIMLDTLIFFLIFLIIYYSFGIIAGFNKVTNYFNLNRIMNISTLITIIVLKEYLRYNVLKKSEFNKFCIFLTIILFIFIDITIYFPYGNFINNYNIFKFIAMIILPSISLNILYSYISFHFGYKPVIFFSLIANLYSYVIPIAVNISDYFYTLNLIILPIIFAIIVYNFLKKEKDEEIKRNYYHNKNKIINIFPIIIFILLTIYFYSGYFRFWFIAIATGSMNPNIKVGDVVIIDKNIDKNNLEEGQVIAYYKGNTIVVHRIYQKMIFNNQAYYITKGDANLSKDSWIVDTENIIGIVNNKISYIGYPTIWIHQMLNMKE